MPRIDNTTNAQSKFLRAFRISPFGPGVADWPSAAILRRWLRKRGFCDAMRDLKEVLIYQADFQMLSVAASAAHGLHSKVTAGNDDGSEIKQIQTLANLLKLSHNRLKFTKGKQSKDKPPVDPLAGLKLIHPSVTMGEAIKLLEEMQASD